MPLAECFRIFSGPAPPSLRESLAVRHVGQGTEGMTPAVPTGLDPQMPSTDLAPTNLPPGRDDTP